MFKIRFYAQFKHIQNSRLLDVCLDKNAIYDHQRAVCTTTCVLLQLRLTYITTRTGITAS